MCQLLPQLLKHSSAGIMVAPSCAIHPLQMLPNTQTMPLGIVNSWLVLPGHALHNITVWCNTRLDHDLDKVCTPEACFLTGLYQTLLHQVFAYSITAHGKL